QKGLEKVKVRLKKADDAEKVKTERLAKAKTAEGREFLKNGDVVGAADSFHAAVDAVPGYKPAKKELDSIRAKYQRVASRPNFSVSSLTFARGVTAYLDRDWAKAYRIWSER